MKEANELFITIIREEGLEEVIRKMSKANLSPYLINVKNFSLENSEIDLNKIPIKDISTLKNQNEAALSDHTEWFGVWIKPDQKKIPVSMSIHLFQPNKFFIGQLKTQTSNKLNFHVQAIFNQKENFEQDYPITFIINYLITNELEKSVYDNSQFIGKINTTFDTIKVSGNYGNLTLNFYRHSYYQPLSFLQNGTIWKGTSATYQK